MQQPSNQSITFQGGLFAGGTHSRPATLTITSSRITLRSFLSQYKFEPHQVVAIEPTDSGAILIKHTLVEYPSEIRFSPSDAASEVSTQMRRCGFTPSAAVEDIPVREGIPVRLQVIIPMMLLVLFLLLADNLLGWVKLHPHQLGRYSPLGMSALFILSLSIRSIPIIQSFVLEPGRHIGELTPLLNLLVLVSGILSLASVLVLLGIPELLVIALCFGVLWVMVMISRRSNNEADAA